MMHSPEFDCPSAKRHARAGFSLIELSVVLSILSIIAVMGLELTANYMDRTAYKVTQQRLDMIDKALVAYRQANNKLPCPANQTLTPSDACYAKECSGPGAQPCTAANGATPCSGNTGTCRSASISTGNIYYGDVPVRDLGLPLSTLLDGYGNRIYYAVTRDHVSNPTMNATSNFNTADDEIRVRSGKLDSSCAGVSLCQDRGTASYFIFSVGADKRGGRLPSSNLPFSCQYDVALTDGMTDTANCRFGAGTLVKNGSTPISIPENVFYDSRFNTGPTDSHFDDLVKWRARGSL